MFVDDVSLVDVLHVRIGAATFKAGHGAASFRPLSWKVAMAEEDNPSALLDIKTLESLDLTVFDLPGGISTQNRFVSKARTTSIPD